MNESPTTEVQTRPASQSPQPLDHGLLAKLVIGGDLSGLSDRQKTDYYLSVCAATGVNPATRPYEFLKLNGKVTLYARKDCTEQLRKNQSVSIEIKSREIINECYVVTAKAINFQGRTDESIGAVPIKGATGDSADEGRDEGQASRYPVDLRVGDARRNRVRDNPRRNRGQGGKGRSRRLAQTPPALRRGRPTGRSAD